MYSDEAWALVEAKAQELATDAFLQLKASYEQRHEQEYKKRQRALTLRIEAAERIGIENIRKARIAKLEATLQQETDTAGDLPHLHSCGRIPDEVKTCSREFFLFPECYA